MPSSERVSGMPSSAHLPGNASRGMPLGNLPGETLPSWECLSGNSLRASPASARSYSHDFLSPCFSPSFSNRSGTPLFRSWHRKTSQNGAQTLPKSSPKRVRNRSYVANPEKWFRANPPTLLPLLPFLQLLQLFLKSSLATPLASKRVSTKSGKSGKSG